MIEIKYSQDNPKMGKLNGNLRILGKTLYFKFNNNQYVEQLISNFKQRGAEIDKSDKTGWIRINMFKGQSFVKLGGREFDVNETSEEEVETILGEFYAKYFTQSGFVCEVKKS